MQVSNNAYVFTLFIPDTSYTLLGKTWKPTSQWTEKELEDGCDDEKDLFALCSDLTFEELQWETFDSVWEVNISIHKDESSFTIESITDYLTAVEKWLITEPTIIADKEAYIVNSNDYYYSPMKRFGKISVPEEISKLLKKK